MLLVKEMQARGIEVEHMEGSKVLIAVYKDHKEIIDDTDLSLMPAPLRYLLDNKWHSKKILNDLKMPTAKGKAFTWSQLAEAADFAEGILPVVLKPVNGSQGLGVRMNINTIDEFAGIFEKLKRELNYETEVLVEEQVEGQEFRLTVTKKGFFAAVYRSCPKVIGNNKNTIRELIEKENFKRMNPRKNCLSEIWMGDGEVERYLLKKGMNLDYKPKKDEYVYLRTNSNISTGAECMDVTEIVHPFYKKLAFELLSKIPGLPYCGIDLITEDIRKYDEKNKYIICEVNPAPGISLHTHPSQGQSRNLAGALIDMIFPESIKSPIGAIPRSTVIHAKHDSLKKLLRFHQAKAPKKWFFKPVALEFEFSTICSLRCTGCAIIEDVEKSLKGFEAEEIINILDQAAQFGIYSYALTGGEPFLNLDLICEVISKSKLDLFKIQTNGTVFSSEKRAKEILNRLKGSGFVKKNKYLKPSIACSIGMQNEAGAPIKNLGILTKAFLEVFGEEASLGINLLKYEGQDENKLFDELEKTYKEISGENYPYEKVRLNELKLEYTDRLGSKNLIEIGSKTLKEKVEELGKDYVCFNFNTEEVDSPVPRILIRANGDLYPCSCFGHACSPGNIKNRSLFSLLEEINKNKLFKIVSQKGLNGLLKHVEKEDKNFVQKQIPSTSNICKACKALRERKIDFKNY